MPAMPVSLPVSPVSSQAGGCPAPPRAKYAHRNQHTEQYAMLQQIVSHTPVYVWAILGLIAVRGVAASRERAAPYRSLFIMPAVMLALGLSSVAGRPQVGAVLAVAWLAAMAAGAALAWRWSGGQVAAVDRAARTVRLRGSWMPLALMMAVFVGKYAAAAATGMQPALAHNAAFAVASCTYFGLCNGVFIGRLLRCVAAFHPVAVREARAA
jgi:hypothetical protein